MRLMVVLLAALLTAMGCASEISSAEERFFAPSSEWALNAEQSGMTFLVSSKTSTEINTFRDLTGSVDANGSARFEMLTASIDTAQTERDNFVKELVFTPLNAEKIVVSTQVENAELGSFEIGERNTLLLDLRIDVGDARIAKDFYVTVTKVSETKVILENKAPLILSASEFGLDDVINQLAQRSGIDFIVPVTAVTISLVFEV